MKALYARSRFSMESCLIVLLAMLIDTKMIDRFHLFGYQLYMCFSIYGCKV